MLFKSLFKNRAKKGNALSYIVVVVAVMGLSVSMMSSVVPGKNNVLQDNNEMIKLLNQETEKQLQKVANDIQGDSAFFKKSAPDLWLTKDSSGLGITCDDSHYKRFYYANNPQGDYTCEGQIDYTQFLSDPSDLNSPIDRGQLQNQSILGNFDDLTDLYTRRTITFRGTNLTATFQLKTERGQPGLRKLLKTNLDNLSYQQPGSNALGITVEGSIEGSNQKVYKSMVVTKPGDTWCSSETDINTPTATQIPGLTNGDPRSLSTSIVSGEAVQLGGKQICYVSDDSDENTGNDLYCGETNNGGTEWYLLNATRYNDTQTSGTKLARVLSFYYKTAASRGSLFLNLDNGSLNQRGSTEIIFPASVSINQNTIGKYIKTLLFPPSTTTTGYMVSVYPDGTNLKRVLQRWTLSGAGSVTDGQMALADLTTPAVAPATTPVTYPFDVTNDRMEFSTKSRILAIAKASDKKIRFINFADPTNPRASGNTGVLPVSSGATTISQFGQITVSNNGLYALASAVDNLGKVNIYTIDLSTLSFTAIPAADIPSGVTLARTHLFYANDTFYWAFKDNGAATTNIAYAKLYSWNPLLGKKEVLTNTSITTDYVPVWPSTVTTPPQTVAMANNQLAIRTQDSVWVLNSTGLYPIATNLGDITTADVNGSIGRTIAYAPPYLYFSDISASTVYRYNSNFHVNANTMAKDGLQSSLLISSTTGASYDFSSSSLGSGSLFASPDSQKVFVTNADGTVQPLMGSCGLSRNRTGQYTNIYSATGAGGGNYTSFGFNATNMSPLTSNPDSVNQGYAIDNNNDYYYQAARSI